VARSRSCVAVGSAPRRMRTGRNRAHGSCGKLDPELEDRLTDLRARPLEGVHQDERRELAESAAVLLGDAYPHCVNVTLQSVTCQPQVLLGGCGGRTHPSLARSCRQTCRRRAESNGRRPQGRTRRPTDRARVEAKPDAREKGLSSCPSSSNASPDPTGRSTQIVVVSRNVTSTPKSVASVAWMTSPWTSP